MEITYGRSSQEIAEDKIFEALDIIVDDIKNTSSRKSREQLKEFRKDFTQLLENVEVSNSWIEKVNIRFSRFLEKRCYME